LNFSVESVILPSAKEAETALSSPPDSMKEKLIHGEIFNDDIVLSEESTLRGRPKDSL